MIYHNNILCLSYAELTDGDPADPDTKQRPVMSVATYRNLQTRGQIEIVRRGCFGQSALVAYRSLPERYKQKVVARYGDPERMAPQSSLRDLYTRDMQAELFFRRYTTDGVAPLKEEARQVYVANASVLNTLLELSAKRTAAIRLRGGSTGRVLRELSEELNAVQDELGCKLPRNVRALKRTIEAYREGGYEALVSRKLGNSNRSKDRQPEQQALIVQLIGDGRNFSNATVARLYNAAAARLGWDNITERTVANYKRKYPEAFAGRRGSAALRNEKLMQVKRYGPSCPMYFWTADGWDVELFYQRTFTGKDGREVTTYHNRLTAVIITDPFCYYIMGYAVGTHETPELIRQAFRNAFEHVRSLLGDYYRPWQLQTDNYGRGTLTPFYEKLSRYFTPAAVGNAKAKPVEPFFRHINDEYFRLLPNSSGYGVRSKKEMQVSDDWIRLHKKDFPDEAGCRRQIAAGIEYFRAKTREQYLQAWAEVPKEKRLDFPRNEWLSAFGEVASPRKLRAGGMQLQLARQVFTYDCFDPEFRNYGHRSFFLRYDPEDMQQVLAVENVGTDKAPVEGGARFVLERKHEQPMALMDRQEGDAEALQRVRDFNRKCEEDIIRKRAERSETLRNFFEENEDRLRDTLTAHVITDSLGSHKNQRNALRDFVPAELPEAPKTDSGTDADYRVEMNDLDFLKDF